MKRQSQNVIYNNTPQRWYPEYKNAPKKEINKTNYATEKWTKCLKRPFAKQEIQREKKQTRKGVRLL